MGCHLRTTWPESCSLRCQMPLRADAIDMNRAAGLQPDGAGVAGLDLEGLVPDTVDRNDKKAFERKMKAKQQNKQGDRRESTKAERDRLAKLLVFEDDVLGSVPVGSVLMRHARVSSGPPRN
jgi:hypothetical protein